MGQCCPAEDANKVFDYRVDTMNSFKQNNRTQIRQTLTESVRRRIMIKAVIKNPAKTYEKVLKIIKKNSYKNVKSNEELMNLLNRYTGNSAMEKDEGVYRTDSISKQCDNALSKIIEKEETFEEEVEKNQMKIVNRELNLDDENKIRQILCDNFLFANLNEDIFQYILREMILIQIDTDKFFFEEGFEWNYFCCVARGKMELLIQNKHIKTYNEWECFGHMSLFCSYNNNIFGRAKCALRCIQKADVYVIDGETFQFIQSQLIKAKLEQNFFFSRKVFAFQSLDNISKFKVSLCAHYREYKNGTKLDERKAYLIKEGHIVCMKNNKEVKKYATGDSVRINSLLLGKEYDTEIDYEFMKIAAGKGDTSGNNKLKKCQTISNAKAISGNENSKAMCYEINKTDIEIALGHDFKNEILYSIFKNVISNNLFFNSLFPFNKRYQLYKLFALHKYESGEYISSNSTKRVIIIIDGIFINDNTHEYLAIKGDIIGERIISKGEEIGKQIVTLTTCVTLECDLTVLSKFLGFDVLDKELMRQSMLINMLKKVKMFEYLTESSLKRIRDKMVKKKFKEGDEIKDDIDDEDKKGCLWLIVKGIVKIVDGSGNLIKEMEAICSFGEDIILNKPLFQKNKISYYAKYKITCYSLSKENFNEIFNNNPSLLNYMKNCVIPQNYNMLTSLKNLFFTQNLGKAKYGNVNLVHDENQFYVLKTISKALADRDKRNLNIPFQRKILLTVNHPFIVKTYQTLKSDSFCYFLSEFINGQNLEDYITKRKNYNNILYNQIQFYIAIMVLIVDYLKQNSIIHRDINPKSFLIEKNGYLKLIDMASAKTIRDYAISVIGEPMYCAPEMIKGKGYSISSDYWSIGICAYVLFFNKYPYEPMIWNDPIKLFQSIISDEIQYPKYKDEYKPLSQSEFNDVVDFIKGLLWKNVNKRMCSFHLIQDVKLFKNFDFDSLLEFKVKAPYLPSLKEINYEEIKNKGSIKYKDYEEGTKHMFVDDMRDKTETWQTNTKWAEEF